MLHVHNLGSRLGDVGRESSPRDKRNFKPTIPGSQGQASSTPTHSELIRMLELELKAHLHGSNSRACALECQKRGPNKIM